MGVFMGIKKLMLALAASVSVVAATLSAHAGGELRIAMTTGELPTTTGAPTQGLEGMRFAGYPVFEPLVMWDLRKAEGPVGVIPWLAEEFAVDAEDKTKWTFRNYANPETVALLDQYRNTFEGDQTELLAKIHERLVDDAPWAYIVHNKNPVAVSAKVKGYTPVQSWYFDLTTVDMED